MMIILRMILNRRSPAARFFLRRSGSDRYSKSRYGQRRDVLDDDSDEQSSFAPRPSASPRACRIGTDKGQTFHFIRGGACGKRAHNGDTCSGILSGIAEPVSQLKQNKQIIIKLDAVERSDAQRILDFMSGAAYALECQVIKISKGIYLFASNDVQIERPEEDETEQTPADDFYNVDDTRRR